MKLISEIIQFIIYAGLIVLISKNILVKTLRNLAENLNLKPKVVGDIAGVATSVPELLTISISSFNGLINASIYNVLSSNIINLIQYLGAIFLNKNQKILKNKAIIVDIILVLITILIPLGLVCFNSNFNIMMIPIFILLYLGMKKINSNAHKLYLKDEDKKIKEMENEIQIDEKNNGRKAIKNVVILVITGILLFFIGNLLGDTLESLCNKFNVPELLIGIVLGFATSLPELITFFEAQKHHKNMDNNIYGVIESTNNLLMSNVLNLFIIQSIGISIFSIMYG
mgnify:FL=1